MRMLKLPVRSFSVMCAKTDVSASKNEMIELCKSIKVGEAVSDELKLKIKESFEKIESHATQEDIVENLPNMTGDWLMLYSSMPKFFHRIALKDLSANTLKSSEPLIICGSVNQIVKEKSPGMYYYDNRVSFDAGKEGEATILGKHTTRGYAGLNYPDSASTTLRLDVEFYESEANSSSSKEEDSVDFNHLFGFPAGETISAPFPPGFKAWSDIVFLDDNLRLMRSGKGNIYVLQKVA